MVVASHFFTKKIFSGYVSCSSWVVVDTKKDGTISRNKVLHTWQFNIKEDWGNQETSCSIEQRALNLWLPRFYLQGWRVLSWCSGTKDRQVRRNFSAGAQETIGNKVWPVCAVQSRCSHNSVIFLSDLTIRDTGFRTNICINTYLVLPSKTPLAVGDFYM